MYTEEDIRELIQAGVPDADIRVSSPDGVHFFARVVSASFAGKSMIEQHRMVYAALGDRVGNEIHALSLKTSTPEQAGNAS